eukprot:1156369-Pelagomonas_calceolata.AAC.4
MMLTAEFLFSGLGPGSSSNVVSPAGTRMVRMSRICTREQCTQGPGAWTSQNAQRYLKMRMNACMQEHQKRCSGELQRKVEPSPPRKSSLWRLHWQFTQAPRFYAIKLTLQKKICRCLLNTALKGNPWSLIGLESVWPREPRVLQP